ncbi:hypothetical protein ACFFJB_13835 [Camelimonas abortus]|uniref:Uncharacterized protein n=1 Tax=Camelimonas abortus TaxID=1017184 RepID=A0ABV7LB46_9HYPH
MTDAMIMDVDAAACPRRDAAVVRLTEPGSILLHDHARLPGRFFGRMTASIQAELTG